MTQDEAHGLEFTGERWDGADLSDRTFSACTFERCSFAGADLSRARFEDCVFRGCNLSNANLANASLQGAAFEDCKAVGLDFGKCRRLLLAVRFADCDLSYGLFSGLDLRDTRFTGCRLREVAFTGCKLGGASFHGADLGRATFGDCDLRAADFREARDYGLDLARNKVKGARFDYPAVLALLAPFELDIES